MCKLCGFELEDNVHFGYCAHVLIDVAAVGLPMCYVVIVWLWGTAHCRDGKVCGEQLIAETARCVELFKRRSGWFGSTELSLTTALQGKQGVEGAYALVRGGLSTSSNLLEPAHCRDGKVCRVL